MTRVVPIRTAGAPAGPHRRLLHALVDLAGGIACTDIMEASCAPWASATFQGTRHLIRLRMSDADAEARSAALAATLPEAEFHLPGHIVADMAVDGRTCCAASGNWLLDLSALTIEDW